MEHLLMEDINKDAQSNFSSDKMQVQLSASRQVQ